MSERGVEVRHEADGIRSLPRRTPTGRIVLSICLVLIAALSLLDRRFPPDLLPATRHSLQVSAADGSLLRAYTTAEGTWRLPVSADRVDPLYLAMLVAYEDRRFYLHPGVDPLAVVRAAGQWLASRHVVSGASTLTMQTARLLEPRPRTFGAKLAEMVRAVQLEWRLEKRRILDVYLNLAPFGGNLSGVRAASLAWLGKEPAHLTAAEAALLVVLPQAPSRLRPDRHPGAARAARDKVLARMAELGVLDVVAAAEAMAEPVPETRRPMPFLAPHLADRLRAAGATGRVVTTLDAGLQRRLELQALAGLQGLDPAASIAIVVVHNPTRAVLAYVGGADFHAARRAGQLDLVRAVRSPGSALKPLIYAMGFDDGLIHPESRILDAPRNFSGYRPGNFMHRYMGEVSVREALQRSLNVPAVAVLDRVGPGRLDARLRQAGVRLRWSGGAVPGLPLALGGVGITLEELVQLYAALADSGRARTLRFEDRDDAGEPVALFSPAASWQTSRILEQAPPPQAAVWQSHLRTPRGIAHKTGTSYGFRDAWAVGYDRDHTVGVWVGRPDGTPLPGHYGRNTAAPLLWRVFDLLPPAPGAAAGTPPPGVLAVPHGQLPVRLQRLEPADAIGTGPRISFPPHGARLALPVRDGQFAPLPLQGSGGARPLRWLVNGRPVQSTGSGRNMHWQPDGPGLARITVLDRHGRAGTAEVWIE